MGYDRGKLEALRRKYGESHGGEMFDPKFRSVADKIFSKSGTRLAPYSGIPTFLAAPYREIAADNPDFGDLQVAIIGVPMDLGVTNRPGSRFGPRALRAIERIGPYNHVLECAPTHRASGRRHRRRAVPEPLPAGDSAMRTSSGAPTRSSTPASFRCRSAATIRSAIRSSRPSARRRRSA